MRIFLRIVLPLAFLLVLCHDVRSGMHLAVFLQHYHTPDCPTAARPYALVEHLSHDHEVTLITSTAWEKQRLTDRFPWTPPGVRTVRFELPYHNSMTTGQRLVSFLRYAVRAVHYGLKMPRPDVIFGSSTPLTAAAAAATVARLRGIPWVFEVRDLWPDFPIQMGVLPGWGLHQLSYGMEAALYRSASEVVTLSPDMETHVRTVTPSASVTTSEYGTDFSLVEAVSDEQMAALRQQFALDRRFLVLYAGTFGRANAIPHLLTAATLFSERSDVLFAFAGQGYHDPLVHRTAQQYNHIRRIPPLAYPEILALFHLADLSLVSFLDLPVLAANSPSKLYDSLATGTPVIVTNPGWTKRLVEQQNCGWYVPIRRPGELATKIGELATAPNRIQRAGRRAATVARRQFDRAKHMRHLQTIIGSTARKT